MNENKLGKKEKMKFAKISKISIDDVLFLGEELYYHLLANQMPFNEIERVIFF